MTTLLGIDLGTSSVKVTLFDSGTLQLIASAAQEYPVYHPRPGYAEQSPADWWRALVTAVRTVTRSAAGPVAAIGLSGQMHGLVCLDEALTPAYPAVIWADTRATAEVTELAAFQPAGQITLPGPPAAGFAAATARWLTHHAPDVLARTRVCLQPKDVMRYRLTGLLSSEPSDASATWLYDIAAGDWATAVAGFCGLRADQLPSIQPSAAPAGALTQAAAVELGLAAGIPVVAGSADLPAQALGHGIVNPTTTLVTVGTGGQVFTPRAAPEPDPTGRTYLFQHNLPGRWYAQAAILSGGLSLRWLRDLLGLRDQPDAYAHLSALAAAVPAGADGLLFLPYLAGERTPHMDPAASGLFLGLRLHHTAGHLARAVMEGVGFALRECLALAGTADTRILLSGGVTQSATWCQILADCWGRPVEMATRDLPRACLGAAILAGMGADIFGSALDAHGRLREATTRIEPNAATAARYADRFARYQHLYPLLRTEMHRLARSEG